ncbi:MAG: hypothetical protein IFK92_06965 [Acidobacteria bacterium]|nr:hypothetical protein [Candidatus Sulfomarinibacter kjeldsenii]
MKKSVYHVTVVLAVVALMTPASAIFADDEGDWKDMKQESKRMKLDETAEEAMQSRGQQIPGDLPLPGFPDL